MEILTDDFMFYKNGKPTEFFARGVVVEFPSSNTLSVKLFCNGKTYKINKADVKILTS